MTPVDEKKPDLKEIKKAFWRGFELARCFSKRHDIHNLWDEYITNNAPAQRPTDKDAQLTDELKADLRELQMAANIADTFHGRDCCGALDRIEAALSAPSREAKLVEALRYAHSQMQPFCDDTIVKQALAKWEGK